MRAAFDGIDVVGKRKNTFRIAVVPLHGDFDADAVFLAFEVYDFGVDCGLRAVEMFDKGQQAAFVKEFVLFLRALVFYSDLDAAIQERELAQALRKNIEAKISGLEDRGVGLESYSRAAFWIYRPLAVHLVDRRAYNFAGKLFHRA